jgi:hypothetical protein
MVRNWARLAFAGAIAAALISGPAVAGDKNAKGAMPLQFAQEMNGAENGNGKRAASPAQKDHQQKMKDCGALWQKAKAAGKTGGRTWNDFAAECLKGKN